MAVDAVDTPPHPRSGVGPGRLGAVAVAAAGVLVAGAVVWARALGGSTGPILLGAPPFAGRWDVTLPPRLLAAVATAAALVVLWPSLATRLGWRASLWASLLTATGWAVVVAASDGLSRLGTPLATRWEYLPLARRVDDPVAFVGTFVERLPGYPTHVQAHPPGPVLGLWVLDRLALGTTAIGLVVIVAFASAAPAVLVAADRLAGREAARRALPFVGLVPAVVWAATSMDALFAATVAWATALLAVAVAAAHRPRAAAAAAGGGLLAGVATTFTYGAPLLLAPAAAVLAVAVARRRWWVPVAAVVAGLVPVLGLAAAGFDWLGGFAATRRAYGDGVADDRPYTYFLVANLAVLAVAIGPAAVAGLARLRDRHLWLLTGAALLGVAVADLSGFAKGEVERIWLPFVPWLALATAGLPAAVATRRRWLALQLGVALVLQTALRSPW